MFGQAIGDVLPLAVAVAISPLPISAVILILLSRRARLNSLAFVAGWILGLTAVGAIVLVFGSASSSSGGDPSTASGVVRVGLGVLFLLLALRNWRSRPRGTQKAEMPRWLDAIGRVSALKSFGAAVVLSAVNPKNLGLTIAAASSIAAASLSPGGEIAVFAVFLAIACVTVIGPALYYAVARRRASRELDALKSWLITHNHTVMAILLLLIGAKLLGDGIGILS